MADPMERIRPHGLMRAMMGHVDFFVIGVQKGGTTAIDEYLRLHSAIQMSRVKEVHHFDNEEMDWSEPAHGSLHDKFDWDVQGVLRGEATPIYIYWPRSLERLQRYNPEAKLIVTLRHPSFRAYSHWRMETARNAESLTFEDAISNIGRDRVRRAPGGVHRVYSYVERGFYADQIERLLTLFPRSRIYVIRTDELWRSPGELLEVVEDFLGMPRQLREIVTQKYIVPLKPTNMEPMPRAARDKLDALFADNIRRTSALTHMDLSDWLEPDYREPMRAQ